MSYLSRLLATPEPDTPLRLNFAHIGMGAKSQKSQRSGEGTFDPFETSPHAHIPEITPSAIWRDGLARVATMPPPPRIQPGRWERIVADALSLGETWAHQAFALGWRDVDLWGCDPDGSRRLDRDGLAMLLNGRAVLAFTASAATIATPGGRTLSYHRAPLDGAVPIWALCAQEGEAA